MTKFIVSLVLGFFASLLGLKKEKDTEKELAEAEKRNAELSAANRAQKLKHEHDEEKRKRDEDYDKADTEGRWDGLTDRDKRG